MNTHRRARRAFHADFGLALVRSYAQLGDLSRFSDAYLINNAATLGDIAHTVEELDPAVVGPYMALNVSSPLIVTYGARRPCPRAPTRPRSRAPVSCAQTPQDVVPAHVQGHRQEARGSQHLVAAGREAVPVLGPVRHRQGCARPPHRQRRCGRRTWLARFQRQPSASRLIHR